MTSEQELVSVDDLKAEKGVFPCELFQFTTQVSRGIPCITPRGILREIS